MMTTWIYFCLSINYLIFGITAGPSVASLSDKIINPSSSNDASIQEFPWHATVANMTGNSSWCGATIISNRHVITSACCITSNLVPIPHVTIGSDIFDGGIKYQVKSNYTHPNYTEVYPFVYDIAIIELDGEITFDDTKRPIALPDKDIPLARGTTVTLVGWGLEAMITFSENLQKQDFTITENNVCDNIIGYITGNDEVTPMDSSQVCGLPIPNTTICKGSMGSGVLFGKNLVGIAIGGTPCGEHLPEFVTLIYDYIDWIREIINRE